MRKHGQETLWQREKVLIQSRVHQIAFSLYLTIPTLNDNIQCLFFF